MSHALILKFKGAKRRSVQGGQHDPGIDLATGEGDWPAGLLSHTGVAG
jgi:hypothetical protein